MKANGQPQIIETFSKKLKSKRKQLRLTQAELAKKLNVSRSTVEKWEQNVKTPAQFTQERVLTQLKNLVISKYEPEIDNIKNQDIKNMENQSILGQFFHSISKEDNQLHEQGVVLSNPEPGWYYLQLFEWGFGQPSIRRLEKIENMHNWLFYENAEMMKYSYDHGTARKGSKYRINES